MKQEQIIKWAREAGFFVSTEQRYIDTRFQKFANLVAQYQKELDADIADSLCRSPSYKAAEAIRGQDETTA